MSTLREWFCSITSGHVLCTLTLTDFGRARLVSQKCFDGKPVGS